MARIGLALRMAGCYASRHRDVNRCGEHRRRPCDRRPVSQAI